MDDETFSLVVKYGKETINLDTPSSATLLKLKQELHAKTDIAPALQKIIFKGALKDDEKSLKDLGLKSGAKLMLVGSKIDEVMKVTTATEKANEPVKEEPKKEEDIFEQQPHKKIIERGVPSEAPPVILGKHESLPPLGINGLLNKVGTRVRLTFKTSEDELVISSNSSSHKIPFAEVTDLVWHEIPKHPNYFVLQFKIGANNNYFVYWVPIQYQRAIKIAVLGYQG